MALPVFPAAIPPPSFVGTSRQTNFRPLEAQFGDGYAQRAEDGLNSVARVFAVSWSRLKVADADIVEAFLAARGGVEPFLWTPPRAAVAVKVVCGDAVERAPASPGSDSLRATFREVFDL